MSPVAHRRSHPKRHTWNGKLPEGTKASFGSEIWALCALPSWLCLQVSFCGRLARAQQSGTHGLCGLFAGQACGNEFSDILAKPALSIEQTHFQKVCPGNKRHETKTISHDGGDKLADDRRATSAFNSRDDAQYVSAFLDDH